jgi:hypothetical protein
MMLMMIIRMDSDRVQAPLLLVARLVHAALDHKAA